MIQFSNAQPIQFWRNTEDTFNEKEVCGINPICFCQPIESSDPLTIQFTDTAGDNFYLVSLDEDYGILEQTIFDKVGTRYQLSGIMTDFTNGSPVGKRQFLIRRSTAAVQSMSAPSAWTNIGTAFDTKNATQFIETALTASSTGARLACVVPTGGKIKVAYTITIAGSFTGAVQALFYLSVVGRVSTNINDAQILFTAAGTYNIIASEEVTSVDSQYLSVSVSGASYNGVAYSGTPSVTITISPAAVLYAPHELKSDCLDVKASHDCTNLINYYNSSDYAGIDYDTSPSPEFNLRVPSVFFHDEPEKEEHVEPLSDDTFIQVSSKLGKKRKLEIGYVPYYFHEKLQLALSHQFIEIDGKEWVLRDSYDTVQGNRRYPLKTATVLLTDKNFIKRNLL